LEDYLESMRSASVERSRERSSHRISHEPEEQFEIIEVDQSNSSMERSMTGSASRKYKVLEKY